MTKNEFSNNSRSMLHLNFITEKMLTTIGNLSIITVNCENVFKLFTQSKLTDVLHCILLNFPNFQKDILQNKKVILHKQINEYSHVVLLIHALNINY